MKERIARSVFWLVWSRGIVQAVSLFSTLLVARLLNPADYGLMALAGIWTSTLGLLVDLGLGTAIIQFPDLEEGELNICFWLTLALASAGYAILWSAAPAIASWFATPRLSSVLRVVGLTLPLIALRVVPEGLLRKRLQLDRVSQAEVTGAVVTIPIVLGLAWRGAGVWALVAAALVAPLVQNSVNFAFARWRPGLQIGSRRLRPLLHYSLASLGAGLCWSAYDQVDSFVLGKVSGNVVLGFYTMAKMVSNLPVQKGAIVIKQVATPLMARLQADRHAMRAFFLREVRFVAALTTPLCVGMALVAPDFVRIALTGKWLPIVPLLQLLCFSAALTAVVTCGCPPALAACYRAGFLFRWNLALLLVMPLAFWAGAAWRGAWGVALAWVVVYPIMMSWQARETIRELEIGWGTVWNQLQPVVTTTLVMAACVLAVQRVVPASVGPLVRIAAAAGSGALVYGLGIVWRDRTLIGELGMVAGWIISKQHLSPPALAESGSRPSEVAISG